MFKSVAAASARTKADVLVLGHFAGQGLLKANKMCDETGEVSCALGRGEATGKVGSITEAFPAENMPARVIVVGLGEEKNLKPSTFRGIAATLGRRLSLIGGGVVEIAFGAALEKAGVDANAAGICFGEYIGLMGFDGTIYKGSASPKDERASLKIKTDDGAAGDGFSDGLSYGLALADSANLARRVVHMPPNEMYPMTLAAEAKKLARQTGMKCTVISGKGIEDNGLVGLKNVGMASEHEPALIRLEYTPTGSKKGSKPLVFVGKSITYDCGGLSIKVGGGMRGMKADMGGGAAVLGAMHAIATVVKPRKRVVAYLAAAENAISDEAYRPDDVITFANGVTVEVTNTDAEGRLVLADALAYACKHDKPGAIVDIATLTGGVVVALGKAFAGMWCDDDDFRGKVEQAGDRTGERVWRLPHDEAYRKMMRSEVADIVNSAPVREAHPIQGAAFLSYFVDENIPWAHVDMASQAMADGAHGACAKGTPTGFGARLLADVAELY